MWVTEICRQREKNRACNLLLLKLRLTNGELHFSCHTVYYSVSYPECFCAYRHISMLVRTSTVYLVPCWEDFQNLQYLERLKMNFIARSKFLFTNLVGKFGLNIWAPIPNQWYENTSRHDTVTSREETITEEANGKKSSKLKLKLKLKYPRNCILQFSIFLHFEAIQILKFNLF